MVKYNNNIHTITDVVLIWFTYIILKKQAKLHPVSVALYTSNRQDIYSRGNYQTLKFHLKTEHQIHADSNACIKETIQNPLVRFV